MGQGMEGTVSAAFLPRLLFHSVDLNSCHFYLFNFYLIFCFIFSFSFRLLIFGFRSPPLLGLPATPVTGVCLPSTTKPPQAQEKMSYGTKMMNMRRRVARSSSCSYKDTGEMKKKGGAWCD